MVHTSSSLILASIALSATSVAAAPSGYSTLAKDGFRAARGMFKSGGRHEVSSGHEGSYDGSGISTAINAAGNLGSGWMMYHQNNQAALAQPQASQRRDLFEELEARDFEELDARTIPFKPFEEAGKFGLNLVKHHKGEIAGQAASIGGMYYMNKQPPQQQQSQYQQRDFEQFDARDFEELDARAFHMGSEVEHGAGRLMGHSHHHSHPHHHRLADMAQGASSMMDPTQQAPQQMDQQMQPQSAQGQTQRREDEFWARSYGDFDELD
jgi:hypothetical protein